MLCFKEFALRIIIKRIWQIKPNENFSRCIAQAARIFYICFKNNKVSWKNLFCILSGDDWIDSDAGLQDGHFAKRSFTKNKIGHSCAKKNDCKEENFFHFGLLHENYPKMV